jgi:hypothetical protein
VVLIRDIAVSRLGGNVDVGARTIVNGGAGIIHCGSPATVRSLYQNLMSLVAALQVVNAPPDIKDPNNSEDVISDKEEDNGSEDEEDQQRQHRGHRWSSPSSQMTQDSTSQRVTARSL